MMMQQQRSETRGERKLMCKRMCRLRSRSGELCFCMGDAVDRSAACPSRSADRDTSVNYSQDAELDAYHLGLRFRGLTFSYFMVLPTYSDRWVQLSSACPKAPDVRAVGSVRGFTVTAFRVAGLLLRCLYLQPSVAGCVKFRGDAFESQLARRQCC